MDADAPGDRQPEPVDAPRPARIEDRGLELALEVG
jgi:hypothetical protein